MLKSIASVLKAVSENSKSKKEAVENLRAANHPVLKQLLFYAYAPQVKFLLPEGAPPYKPCDFLDQEGRLYTEARKLYLFIEGGNPNLTKFKREMLFIQLLESISKDDAVLLINIKDKKLPYKNLTKAVVEEAFPDLLPKEDDDEQVTA